MRRLAYLAPLLLLVSPPAHAGAQDNQICSARPHADNGARKTETKPFNQEAAAAKPWFDLSSQPAPTFAANLGNHRYSIAAANDGFNQGLIYAYGFNHLEALRAFMQAQAHDPDCAMCFWGEPFRLTKPLAQSS